MTLFVAAAAVRSLLWMDIFRVSGCGLVEISLFFCLLFFDVLDYDLRYRAHLKTQEFWVM